jgi:hypothetical protein
LIETAGFLIAALTLIVLASRGDAQSRLADVVAFAALLTVAAGVIFVWALGLPLPLLPDVTGFQ